MALTKMIWCQYVAVKPHRATNSSLNVTLFCHLYALHTVPWARSTGLSYSPTPTLSNIFQDYIFLKMQPKHPILLEAPCVSHGLGMSFPCVACSLKMRLLSIIIQVTEFLQYSKENC